MLNGLMFRKSLLSKLKGLSWPVERANVQKESTRHVEGAKLAC